MAWSDEPTYAQLQTIFRWLNWRLPTPLATAATKYLENNATRREVSQEMKRLRELYISHNLTMATAFSGEVWSNFVIEEEK